MMDEPRGQSLRTVELPHGSVVAVGDVVRWGDDPLAFGRVTEVLDDGKRGPIVAAYRQFGNGTRGLGVPKLMRPSRPPVVALEWVPDAVAREQYRMEAARRVVRRLNVQGGAW
jgi:hypothetical protein